MRHLQELREAEKDIVARAEEILSGNVDLSVQQQPLISSRPYMQRNLSRGSKKMLRSRSSQSNNGEDLEPIPGPVGRPVLRVQGSRNLFSQMDLNDDDINGNNVFAQENPLSQIQSKNVSPKNDKNNTHGFKRMPISRILPKISVDNNTLDTTQSLVGENDLIELMNERTLSRGNNSQSNRSLMGMYSSRSLLEMANSQVNGSPTHLNSKMDLSEMEEGDEVLR